MTDASTVLSTGTTAINTDPVKAKESLLAELTTAKALLNDSETPEAASFWTNYIDDLENRLASLPAEGASNAAENTTTSSVAAGSVAAGSVAAGSVAAGSVAAGSVAAGSVAAGSVAAGSVSSPGQPVANEPLPNIASNSSGIGGARESFDAPSAGGVTEGKNLFSAPMVTRQPVNLDDIQRTNQNEILVDVVAPVDLPDGYTFEARMGEKRFMATVPPGGVMQGQTFQCPMKEVEKTEFAIPERRWKDGMCDFLSEGVCHPFLCNSIFCPLIAVGQVATRLHLNWFGRSGTKVDAYSVQNNILAILAFWFVLNVIAVYYMLVQWVRGWWDYSDVLPLVGINFVMYILTVIIIVNTRKSVREKCEIADDCPGEDLCKTITCMPCTVSQMGRHTADYDNFPGYCCTRTGLPDNVAIIAPSNGRSSNYSPPVESEMV